MVRLAVSQAPVYRVALKQHPETGAVSGTREIKKNVHLILKYKHKHDQ